MSLLDAHGYEAVFATPEGDTYRVPLVCWRDDGDQLYGVALIKGHLRRPEQVQGFLRYAAQEGTGPAVPFAAPPIPGRRPSSERSPALN